MNNMQNIEASVSSAVTPGSVPFSWPDRPRKVALVHYWLVGMRGGEKVLEALCELFPEADIFTLVADPEKLSPTIRKHKITTSFLQKMGGKRHYQKMLPLMPFALESFDLTGYDLIISSEAGPAKGIIPRPDALHICYCHSPMRYIWDLYPQYRAGAGFVSRAVLSHTAPLLRAWDVSTAARVDHFIANSAYVAKRIEKFYRRKATVVHPPVDVERFSLAEAIGDYYLCAGQITPYKRIDIAVDAFTKMGKPLVVIGSGASAELKKKAGPNVQFLGAVDDATMAHHFARCKALIFPGVEDFGIVPLEVMASGRPVIAFARGGAVETVIDGKTGVLFTEQTSESLIEAVGRLEHQNDDLNPHEMRDWSLAFQKRRFIAKLSSVIDKCIRES